MRVMKFGGSSVGDKERLQRMASLVVAETDPVVVVVSAMGKTTDHLLAAGDAAERGDPERMALEMAAIRAILAPVYDSSHADPLLEELANLLQGVTLLREQTPRSRALLASFGERLSVGVAASAIREAGARAEPVDARPCVRTDATFEEGRVDTARTNEALRARLSPLVMEGVIPVVTGFLGSTADGLTTVLGRSGSDYTASIVGAALDVDEVVIWTDVDGILTADPRKVSEARTLSAVSYREAAEMSWFGAQVIHPKTMVPVMESGIPIRVRSTFSPDQPGTVISESSGEAPYGVKTVSSVEGLTLLSVEGGGMAGLIGTARRIFAITESVGANVMMISQATSEQSVSLVVRADEADALYTALCDGFALELDAGLLAPIKRSDGVSVVSIVGRGMAGTPGVSARLFDALGELSINVRAIAQAASELSISVAVDDSQVERAVRAIHTAFGLTRIVHVALIGMGLVGRTLCEQLASVEMEGVELRISLAANSRTWVLDPEGIPPHQLAERLAAGEARPDDATLIRALSERRFTETILVDVSAADTQPLHREALRAGFHVVTANKVPLSGSFASYRELVDARDAGGIRYGYETTFGAGLPVLHTLKELVATGDVLRTVEGCFSGTLGFLCSRLDAGVSVVDAVSEAKELGFTEPDPREDLSGRDVARKALIVARAMGRSLEMSDLILEPVLPGLERGLEVAIAEEGPKLEARVRAAAAEGRVIRYVAHIGEDVTVGLREVEAVSPIGSLRGPDNILVFTTERYADNPLVVRGPGAGAAVTAAGVLGDLLKIARR